MLTDPIADMLIRIKNGYLARHKTVEFPYSKMKESLAEILVKTGFLAKTEVLGQKKPPLVRVTLKYEGKTPALAGVQRVSKPGLRIYAGKDKLPQVLGGLGTVIVSTPRGLMTDKEAKKLGLGGEVICKVW